MSSIDFDEVLLHVGEKGRYQNIMYYLLCIPATLPAAFLAFSQVFVSASPEHWCRIPELDNMTDLMSLEERKALSIPYSVKSDGRRVYSKCHMFDVNYTEIIDLWLEGANPSNTTDSPSLTTSPSFDLPSTRSPPVSSPDWPTVKCRYGWNYDTRDYDSTLVTEGYLLRHWYTLSLATSVPFILLFSYYWIIPESPRWLLSKNRIDEAEAIVQQMAKVNGKTVPTNFLRKMEVEILKRQGISCNGRNSNDIDLEGENRATPSSATPMDLITNPNIRKKFFILAFDWVANAVVYNGLSYNTTNLGVSDYLAFFIGGLVEIPSYFITWYAMDRLGRRWVLCVTMMLGGLACVSCMFVPEADAVWVTVSLAMIGKFGIAASFAVFYVFVGELLPTVLRSQAMGIASFIAGIGLLTFPYIVHLAVYSRVLPLIVMGSLSVAGAITSIFLPETLNIHLPQTVEEGELFGADFKLWSCPTIPKKGSSKSESLPLGYLVNGGPGSRSSTSKVASQEGATTSQGEKPAALLPSKEEEAKNLSAPKAEELSNIEVVEPKTASVLADVSACRKSQ
ncbi:PREDICTED: carcinine transporter-like isoform X3 [Trachymyrmex septentrionalis]|uniref:carcinine transporter-like isoform X3 n=1 Tax=Trachymyrmex septentrionalis TaxID=34720 RepID=UPI00084F366C|nr:PREDICTED: carcinine transporter-like isoform X3 [Trachymyrmex septentrionalis]